MNVAVLPHEYRLLGLKREPWTAEDVLTVGRLASIDINWLVWFRLMPLRDRAGWPQLFARVLDFGGASLPSFGAPESASSALLGGLLLDHGRTGSNFVAVAGTRTASGAAMIANDPHLGVSLPNLWLVAGARSPSFHVVGLMPPGLPIFGVGRNPDVAWGGTNMRAASSDLVDVSGLPPEAFTTREQRIGVRWWFDRTVTVRDSPWGQSSPTPQWSRRATARRWRCAGPATTCPTRSRPCSASRGRATSSPSAPRSTASTCPARTCFTPTPPAMSAR